MKQSLVSSRVRNHEIHPIGFQGKDICARLRKVPERATQNGKGPHQMHQNKHHISHNSRFAVVLYLLLVIISFWLLATSRSGEIHTVWESIHPAFIPTFFATTFVLLVIIFSSEKTSNKLLFIILHSILSNSLFILIFPAGDIGGQQIFLGRTRTIFNNIILNGWPPTTAENILGQIYNWFRGTNLQAALSVMFARMLSIDVYWSHVLLVPILWGTFIPLSMFMTTKTLIPSEKVSVLSALLISGFPIMIFWGAISVANSLGYIFFSCSVYFFLKYLTSNDYRNIFLMIIFSLISFLGHFLMGMASFSLLFLVVAFKKYEKEKDTSPKTSKFLVGVSFVFCVSLLPIVLLYLKLFYPMYAYFTLEKVRGLSTVELVSVLFFGEYLELKFSAGLTRIISPLLGLASVIYVVTDVNKRSSNKLCRMCVLYFFAALLMFVVDHRVLGLFVRGVPFAVGRLWMFQYFVIVPFLSVVAQRIISVLHRKASNTLKKLQFMSLRPSTAVTIKTMIKFVMVGALLGSNIFSLAIMSGWVTASLYTAYPHWAPLQTTSYELEAVKYIDETAKEKYIVIADMWIIFAGQTSVGTNNPRAFYFSHTDPRGISLFIEMKSNPSNETMIQAMETNNASIAYFIIEKPRLGTEEYNRITSQAEQNGIQTYPDGVFSYKGEEKLRIFYYRKSSDK